MPVRVLTLITFFLGAFTLVQAILLLSEYYSNYDVSMPVVILFLLITPFAFVAALMFAFGVHKIAQGNGADKNIILGFAMMLLLAVDNLIYIPIHYRGDNGDPLSFMILGAIELICLIIFFLYYFVFLSSLIRSLMDSNSALCLKDTEPGLRLKIRVACLRIFWER